MLTEVNNTSFYRDTRIQLKHKITSCLSRAYTPQLKQANALSDAERRQNEDVKIDLKHAQEKVEQTMLELERAYEKIAILIIMQIGACDNIKHDAVKLIPL